MKAEWAKYRLFFKFEAQTSRERMSFKDTYFVRLTDENSGRSGVGECALFRGLSADDCPDYEVRLSRACANPESAIEESSIRFGFETAIKNLKGATCGNTPFIKGEEGIRINGLIWMGDKATMRKRIDEKLSAGFHVLKLKIGGIDFNSEVDLLRYIRSLYSPTDLEMRLDANGSFAVESALERLKRLSAFSIHSIEQPIRAGQREAMALLCEKSPIAIALDEELIGVKDTENLLDEIRPQYIILKPALCGGLSGADHWSELAEKRGIGWWATSALESNVGLCAIAQWASQHAVSIPQGLGTGQLYYNNVGSPLYLDGEFLYYNPDRKWKYPELVWQQ